MEFTRVLESLSSFFPPSRLTKKSRLPLKVLLLSPHPDDEAINGSLPLRLAFENGAKIINVAVTLGSHKERQAERLRELQNACALLKFENVVLSDDWKKKEKELKTLIKEHAPDLIVAPHLKDHHPTHIKTGALLKAALLKRDSTVVAWNEFWGPMSRPNLLVEVPLEIVELQMKALAEHVGEVQRNPYHLRLPAWMMDNVRRGSEVIGGKGTEASQMAFGVLYRVQLYKQGKFSDQRSVSFATNDLDLGQFLKSLN